MKEKIQIILKSPFIFLLKFYKYCVSPFTPAACRYFPTCSEYSEESIKKHGVFKGGILTIKRLFRCHPFSGSGYDPVPEEFNVLKNNKIK